MNGTTTASVRVIDITTQPQTLDGQDFILVDNPTLGSRGIPAPEIGAAPRVETMADLATRDPGAGMVNVTGYYNDGDWGPPRVARWQEGMDPGLHDGGAVVAAQDGSGCWTFTDVERDVVDPRWWGAKANEAMDCQPAIQAAIDYAASRGGCEVKLGPGNWEIHSSLRLKTKVCLSGSTTPHWQNADPVNRDFREHGLTVIRGRPQVGDGIQENGFGFTLLFVDYADQTGQDAGSFTSSVTGETMTLRYGHCRIENLIFDQSYSWTWNGNAAVAVLVNCVAAVRIKACGWFKCASIPLYIRGGFGQIVEDSFFGMGCLRGPIFESFSDSRVSDNLFSTSNGYNLLLLNCNTIIFEGNTLWNDFNDLSRSSKPLDSAGYYTELYWTANTGSNTITRDTPQLAGLDTGWPIMFFARSGGTLPAPFIAGKWYWVRTSNGFDFSVHGSFEDAIANSEAIDITTTGSGLWQVGVPQANLIIWLSEEVQIVGNRLDESLADHIRIEKCRKTTVTGNQIWETGTNGWPTRANARLKYQTDYAALRVLDTCGLTVTGNHIDAYDYGARPSASTGPWLNVQMIDIDLLRVAGIVVSGNYLGWAHYGVRADNASTGIEVTSNVVHANMARPYERLDYPLAGSGYLQMSGQDGQRLSGSMLPIGAGDFTVSLDVELPPLTGGAAVVEGIMALCSSSVSGYEDSSFTLVHYRDPSAWQLFPAINVLNGPENKWARVTWSPNITLNPVSGWHNITVSRKAGIQSLILYVDGRQIVSELFIQFNGGAVSTDFAHSLVTTNYVLGVTTVNTTEFTGKIGALRVFNRALSIDEIEDGCLNPCGADRWSDCSSSTSGLLTVGRRYRIETYNAADNFLNVGAAANSAGTEFVATGTTPTAWTGGSTLRVIGCVLFLDFESGSGNLVHDRSTNALHGTAFSGASVAVRDPKPGVLLDCVRAGGVANGSDAPTLSGGPTGTAGAPKGWVPVKVGNATRYMPFW